MKKPKITFSKSEPYSQGWRGWSDAVDVLVDGAKVGELVARDQQSRRSMEYRIKLDTVKLKNDTAFGLRDAKAKVRDYYRD